MRDAPPQPFGLLALAGGLSFAGLACSGLITDPGGSAEGPGDRAAAGETTQELTAQSRVLRLTHEQYASTVRVLLGLDDATSPTDGFIADDGAGAYGTDATNLRVGEALHGDYERAAWRMADTIIASEELRAALGVTAPGFVATFVERCLRGRADVETVAAYEALHAACAATGDAIEGGRCVIAACLQDPELVYRLELADASRAEEEEEPLTGIERASALSFLLTRGMPSSDLVAAARAGALETPEGVVVAARELLDGPDAVNVVRAFHDGWLGLDTLEGGIVRDAERFPELPADAGASMRAELLRFVESVATGGGGLREILLGRTAFVDATTAAIYGVDVSFPAGVDVVEVDLPEAERAGLITRAAFAALGSDERSTSPILRGAWIARNLECIPIEPPDAAVPPLPPEVTGMPMTMRERVRTHTETGDCAACHTSIINPPGYALEHYDALGRFVTSEWNGLAIDSNTVLTVGSERVPIDDGVSLSLALAEQPEVYDCYVRAWMQYLYGRQVERGDLALARALGDRMMEGSVDLHALVDALLASDGFLRRSRELVEGVHAEGE